VEVVQGSGTVLEEGTDIDSMQGFAINNITNLICFGASKYEHMERHSKQTPGLLEQIP